MEISDRIFQWPRFATSYDRFLTDEARRHIRGLEPSAGLAPGELAFLLECAGVLCRCAQEAALEAALRIATSCLDRSGLPQEYRTAAAAVVTATTNIAGLRYAIERGALPENYEDAMPLGVRVDSIQKQIQCERVIAGQAMLLNQFQLGVLDAAKKTAAVSASAPTSAGKSFVLRQLVADAIKDGAALVVYVVPTRALIHEIEQSLRKELRRVASVAVSSLPRLPPREKRETPFVCVVTQERLHWMIAASEEPFVPDLLIIDEAQKIGDGARGILLDDTVTRMLEDQKTTRVIMASPMASNPEVLQRIVPDSFTFKPLTSDHVAVTQDVYWVSQIPRRPKRWSIELRRDGQGISLGAIDIEARLENARKRLVLVARALSEGTCGNLIYVNGPAEAEESASLLASVEAKVSSDDGSPIGQLIELVCAVVHPKYALVEALRHGVAFHYGNMPHLVRTEIERLFSDGAIKYLICTSTLVEGVNLPARAIFLRGPKRGNSTPMGPLDFWNLAGRAGRLGKELHGAVVCIEPLKKDVWKVPPPESRTKYPIAPALENTLEGSFDDVIAATNENDPSKPVVEATLSALFSVHLRSGNLNSQRLSGLPAALREQLQARLTDLAGRVSLASGVFVRNVGISPLALQKLYVALKAKPEHLDFYVPVFPEHPDAEQQYDNIIKIINEHMLKEHPAILVPRRILVLHWMRGRPLSYIIEKNWEYWRRQRDRKRSLATVIRETMRDVEEYARFRFARALAAYVDILKHVAAVNGREDLVADVEDAPLWLEYGASTPTQMSLMSLGLSRTTALAASGILGESEMNTDMCRAWLTSQDLDALPLPYFVLRELAELQQESLRDAAPAPEQSGEPS